MQCCVAKNIVATCFHDASYSKGRLQILKHKLLKVWAFVSSGNKKNNTPCMSENSCS